MIKIPHHFYSDNQIKKDLNNFIEHPCLNI
jgi:hypothetical protein